MWRAVRREPAQMNSVVAAEQRDRIIGFDACGGQRDEALAAQGFEAKIGAIYVLSDSQRLSVGGVLMKLLASRFSQHGRTVASPSVRRATLLPGRSANA